MFQLPHLCCMWGKLPQYAARMQRDMLGPEMYGDEEAVTDAEVLGRELLPEVRQELQVRGREGGRERRRGRGRGRGRGRENLMVSRVHHNGV
jgi:hypothetical protein